MKRVSDDGFDSRGVMSRPGRRSVLIVVVVALVVCVAVAPIAYDAILESWSLRQLRSEDAAVVASAAENLGRLRSRKAVAPLVDLSVRPLERMRTTGAGDFPATAAAVVAIGDRAVPELVRILEDGEASRARRRTAARLLGAMEPVANQAFVELGRNDDAQVRVYALYALSFLEDAGLIVAELRRALGDPDPGVRTYVLGQIADFDAGLEPLLPSILDAVEDRDPGVAEAARALLLGYLESREREDSVLLRDAILANAPGIRLRMAECLSRLEKEHPDVREIRSLLEILAADRDVAVRDAAAGVPDDIAPDWLLGTWKRVGHWRLGGGTLAFNPGALAFRFEPDGTLGAVTGFDDEVHAGRYSLDGSTLRLWYDGRWQGTPVRVTWDGHFLEIIEVFHRNRYVRSDDSLSKIAEAYRERAGQSGGAAGAKKRGGGRFR